MAIEQAAGYCTYCNKAVTVRRKSGPGVLRKLSSLIAGQNESGKWECTKCGQTASRSFIPPAAPGDASTPTDRAVPAPTRSAPPVSEPSESRQCPHCRGEIRRDASKCVHCDQEVQPLPKLAEALCHICGNTLRFEREEEDRTRSCPTCMGTITLPGPAEGRLPKTTPPPVITFPDDPTRPGLTLAMCVACERRLTYQKKHAGRELACPECGKAIVLP